MRATDSCLTLIGARQCGVLTVRLDDGLFLYPPQVKHLWFQQKLIEAINQSVIVHSNTKDADGGGDLVAANRTSVPWPRINFVDPVSWRNIQ